MGIRVLSDKCIGCKLCVPSCPFGLIEIIDRKAAIKMVAIFAALVLPPALSSRRLKLPGKLPPPLINPFTKGFGSLPNSGMANWLMWVLNF